MDYLNRGVNHCVDRVVDGTPQCIEAQKFVSLHFETFCHQVCDASYCEESYDQCGSGSSTTTTASTTARSTGASESPLSPAWCHCPSTEVLEYVRSAAPVIVTHDLPVLPAKPVVLSHSGEQEGEHNPVDQQIQLTLDSSSEARLHLARNFRVRVLWSESSVIGNVATWTEHGHTFDTYSNDHIIQVHPLFKQNP